MLVARALPAPNPEYHSSLVIDLLQEFSTSRAEHSLKTDTAAHRENLGGALVVESNELREQPSLRVQLGADAIGAGGCEAQAFDVAAVSRQSQ